MPLHCSSLPGIEDPNFFFQQLLSKPYAQQVVWGPHFYGQSVIPYELPKSYMQVSGVHIPAVVTSTASQPMPGSFDNQPAHRLGSELVAVPHFSRVYATASRPLQAPVRFFRLSDHKGLLRRRQVPEVARAAGRVQRAARQGPTGAWALCYHPQHAFRLNKHSCRTTAMQSWRTQHCTDMSKPCTTHPIGPFISEWVG